jgi:ABC-type xylose transport system permease subunit
MFSKADIEKYFIAEKNESLLFIILGIAAIILALVFFFYLKTNWYKGAAIPFLIVGIMHFIVGVTVYKRSDGDRQRNVYAYDLNPGELKAKELPRMEKVNRNFVVIRYFEIVLLLIGLGLIFSFKNNLDKNFWVGLGMALAVEAVVSLGADYFAEKRAKEYTNGLIEFTSKP